jgi:hypothetical protein
MKAGVKGNSADSLSHGFSPALSTVYRLFDGCAYARTVNDLRETELYFGTVTKRAKTPDSSTTLPERPETPFTLRILPERRKRKDSVRKMEKTRGADSE